MVGVVVLNYNDSETTEKYVSVIQQYDYINHIVVVDNASTDNSFDRLINLKSKKTDVIRSDYNGGYGYGNNFGIKFLAAEYGVDYIAITNPDVEYSEETLIKCVSFLEDHKSDKFVICAPKMKNLDGKCIRSAWSVPNINDYYSGKLRLVGHGDRYNYVDADPDEGFVECGCVAGSMLVVNQRFFSEIGMYDENIFLYCEESAIGIKCKQHGFKTALLYNCSFIHAHSVSINKNIKRKRKQNSILWKSRNYILRDYYGIKGFQWVPVKIMQFLSMIEVILREIKHGANN